MRRSERLDDLEEGLRIAMDSHQSHMWTALPGIVAGVDLAAQTLSVQPSVQGSITAPDGSVQAVNLPLLVDVPVVWPRAGGFALTFPIKAGDEVLVVFASRCIDAWWQSGDVGAQAEARMHDLSDGFAILAPTSQPKKFENINPNNVQLRDESGTTYVEITPDGAARVVAATKVDIEAPSVNIKGNVVHSGGSWVSNGITFGSHKHTGVVPGSGTSGGPTN
jgi:hypothetical protein